MPFALRRPDADATARATAAGVAYGIPRRSRTFAVRAALAAMQAEIDELQDQVASLNGLLAAAEARAERDALVPVYNRRGFMREFERFLMLSRRREIPACLAYFDLVGFKSINDRDGHAAGDAVLIAVGDALRRRTRASDIVGRLGGDEFAVLLTHAEPEAARAKVDDIVTTVRSLKISDLGARLGIDVSVGLCALDSSQDAETLIARADRAMYAARGTIGPRR